MVLWRCVPGIPPAPASQSLVGASRQVEDAKDLGEPLQCVPDLLELVWRDLLSCQGVQEVADIDLSPWDSRKASLPDAFVG